MTPTAGRVLAAALALLPATVPPAAAQDMLAAVNAIRSRGCDGKPAAGPALTHDARLNRAAAALAAGADLKEALQSAEYRATQAALLEVSGEPGAIENVLAEKGCKDILDAVYRDIGFAKGERRSWILLAAPLVAPAAADAVAIAGRVLTLVNAARREKRRCGLKRF
ncbi:MAG TPA: hypothetical protein VFR77_05550, partial [Steroidobacteraceae bacterium]|nr:hypothetical protein [Steroidobacteraceae bacterium]